MDSTTIAEPEQLESIRQPWTLFTIYSVFYFAVFFAGLVGNTFVVLAVFINSNLRTATDYLISSLAWADLLIILFCLPTTLLNNLLTEWQLGAIGCKLSTFINSTTSCASIFTLVAVTADRYLAICHTLKYTLWEARQVMYMIAGIWLLSALLASPNLWIYDEILYDLSPPNGTLVARLCISTREDFLHFIIVNLVIAFLVPIILISVSYALIFRTVTNHRSLAVDARIRDERVKLRVAQMMLTVIIVFMLCWTPLYGLYCYFFLAPSRETYFFQFASSVLRPIFQWLSLLSSSLNPLIYIAYSQKYRRAFHQLLLLPCRTHYQSFRRATRATFRLPPLATQASSSNGGGGGNSERETIRGSYQWGGTTASTTARLDGELNKWGRKVSLQNGHPDRNGQHYYWGNLHGQSTNGKNLSIHNGFTKPVAGNANGNGMMRKFSEQPLSVTTTSPNLTVKPPSAPRHKLENKSNVRLLSQQSNPTMEPLVKRMADENETGGSKDPLLLPSPPTKERSEKNVEENGGDKSLTQRDKKTESKEEGTKNIKVSTILAQI